MELEPLLARMERFPDALARLLEGIPGPDARWRPEPGAWSLTEIAGHLLDEESEDFRTRVRSTLEDPAAEWPSIDPERTVLERGWRERDLARTLARFAEERRASLAWLRSLVDPPWEGVHDASWGPIRAGDVMLSWAAHDPLHLRQVARRLHQLAERDARGFSSGYAGPW